MPLKEAGGRREPQATARARGSVTSGGVAIQPIKRILEEAGYSVDTPGVVHGSSGATHRFDVVAKVPPRGGGEEMTVRLVLDVAVSSTPITEHPVISLFAKVFDTSPTKAVLVAVPSLNEMGRKLAGMYKLVVIEGRSVEYAINRLKRLLAT